MKKQFKRWLSLTLALVLVLGLLPLSTARADDILHDYDIDFEPWSDSNDLPVSTGSYYLTTDLLISSFESISGETVNLHLNGHTVEFSNISNYGCRLSGQAELNIYDTPAWRGRITVSPEYEPRYIFNVSGRSTLNLYGGSICDSNVSTCAVYVGGGSTFNMRGGCISGIRRTTNGTVSSGGVAVSVSGSTAVSKFVMSGGWIENNQPYSEDENYDTFGTVYVGQNGEFTMSGGSIRNNMPGWNAGNYSGSLVLAGGGVYVGEGGSFIMSEGEIRDNVSLGGTVNGGGGGIAVYRGGSATISGGRIYNNYATQGGGVYCYDGNVTIEGGYISDNSAVNGGGVYQFFGTVSMSDGVISNNSAEYGGGVYVNTTGTFQISNCPAVYSNNSTWAGDDVYLLLVDKLTVTGSLNGAHVGVTRSDGRNALTGVFTSGLVNYGDAFCFFSPDGFSVGNDENGEACFFEAEPEPDPIDLLFECENMMGTLVLSGDFYRAGSTEHFENENVGSSYRLMELRPDMSSGTVTAQPIEGYNFAYWCQEPSLDPFRSEPELNVSELTESCSLIAKFEPQSFTVSWLNWDGTPLIDRICHYGEAPVYDAAPPERAAEGNVVYNFVGWTDGSNSYGPNGPFPAVTGDVSYTAVFEAVETAPSVDLTLQAAEHGTITIAGGTIVLDNGPVDITSTMVLEYDSQVDLPGFHPTESTAVITAVPEEGYEVSGWFYEDGTLFCSGAVLDYSGLTESCTLVPGYAPKFFVGNALTLESKNGEGDIGILFYMDLSAAGVSLEDIVSGEQSLSVSFDWNGDTQPKSHLSVYQKTATQSNYSEFLDPYSTYLVVKCDVAAAEMSCPVHITASINGQSFETTYSVQEYGNVILAPESAYSQELKDLVTAMLNYGTTAQNRFGIHPENPANGVSSYHPESVSSDAFTAAVKAANGDAEASDLREGLEGTGLSFYGASLVYLTKTTLRLNYKVEDETAFNSLEGREAFHERGSYVYLEVVGIGAPEMAKLQSFSFGGKTYRYSPLDYARETVENPNATQASKDAATALYWYYTAAKNYFAPSSYDVRLDSAGSAKIKVIQVVRTLTGLGLSEAKRLVESAPCIILTKVSADTANDAKAQLEAAGATVTVLPHTG